MIKKLFALCMSAFSCAFIVSHEQSYITELEALWQRPEYTAITRQGIAADLICKQEWKATLKDPAYERFHRAETELAILSYLEKQCFPERSDKAPLALLARPDLTPRIFEFVQQTARELSIVMPCICIINTNGPVVNTSSFLQTNGLIIVCAKTALQYSDAAFKAALTRALIEIAEYASLRTHITQIALPLAGGLAGTFMGAGLTYLLYGKAESALPNVPFVQLHQHLKFFANVALPALYGCFIGLAIGKYGTQKIITQHALAREQRTAKLLHNKAARERIQADAQYLLSNQIEQARLLEEYAAHIAQHQNTHENQLVDLEPLATKAAALRTTRPAEPITTPSIKSRLQALEQS